MMTLSEPIPSVEQEPEAELMQAPKPLQWQLHDIAPGAYALRLAKGGIIYSRLWCDGLNDDPHYIHGEHYDPCHMNGLVEDAHRSEFISLITEDMFFAAREHGWIPLPRFIRQVPKLLSVGAYALSFLDEIPTLSKIYAVHEVPGLVRGAHFNTKRPDGEVGEITLECIVAIIPRDMFGIALQQQWKLSPFQR